MVYEARYLARNCELKTRLSDIVSHLRNDCRQIVTQQLQKSFSTMSTACKFSEMPLFIYLSSRFLRSLFKKFENKCKNKHEVHVYDQPWPCLLAHAMAVFLTLTFKWLSGARAQDKTKQYYCCFLFSHFIQLRDSRKIHYLTREFRINCTWKPISHSSLRDSCDIGFRVQFNAEFPRQVMNFPIVSIVTVTPARPLKSHSQSQTTV